MFEVITQIIHHLAYYAEELNVFSLSHSFFYSVGSLLL